MDSYDVELEEAEGRLIGTVRSVPGLLVFGNTVDGVLEQARAAIAFRAGRGSVAGRENCDAQKTCPDHEVQLSRETVQSVAVHLRSVPGSMVSQGDARVAATTARSTACSA